MICNVGKYLLMRNLITFLNNIYEYVVNSLIGNKI